jgi:hypothetical protein
MINYILSIIYQIYKKFDRWGCASNYNNIGSRITLSKYYLNQL